MLAIQMIAFAEPLSEYLAQVKEQSGLLAQLPIPDLDEWLDLYKKPSRLKKMFRTFIVNFQEAEKLASEYYNSLMNGLKDLNLNEAQVDFIQDEFNKYGLDVLNNEEGIDREKYKCTPKTLYSEFESTKREYNFNLGQVATEQLFFLKVFAPCQFLYKTHPIKLLRKAKNGDIDALEKLMRVDNSIIFEKNISKIYHNSKTKRIITERLDSAFGSTPKGKIDKQKIKMVFTGLISYFSDVLGHRLNEPEIRELFDRVAKMKKNGDIDTDIPDSPETFTKAIQRERKFWEDTIIKKI